jgi:hypothetical protein
LDEVLFGRSCRSLLLKFPVRAATILGELTCLIMMTTSFTRSRKEWTIRPHERQYKNFIKVGTIATAAVATLLVLMALTLT